MNSTKYAVSVFVRGEWVSIALFANTAERRAMIRFASTQYDEMEDCEDAVITDMDTGEILWQCCDDDGWNQWETESSGDDWDIDEADLEMGYNPYEGCYDYDC